MEIDASEMLAACRDYLGFVVSPQRASETAETRNVELARRLDRLAWVIHALTLSKEDPNIGLKEIEPVVNSERIYRLISSAFPDFGWYCVVYGSVSTDGPEVLTGDAIDDLRDIYLDLNDFVWKYENGSKYWAIHGVRDMYRVHWGRHLRDVQSYLHSAIYGS